MAKRFPPSWLVELMAPPIGDLLLALIPQSGTPQTLPYLTLCAPFFDDTPNTPNNVGGNEDCPQFAYAKRHIDDFHRCRSLIRPGRKKRPATGCAAGRVLFGQQLALGGFMDEPGNPSA
jgi:hypothetical protein